MSRLSGLERILGFFVVFVVVDGQDSRGESVALLGHLPAKSPFRSPSFGDPLPEVVGVAIGFLKH